MRDYFAAKLIAGCSGFIVLCIWGCGYRSLSPEEVFLQFKAAIESDDISSLGNLVSKDSIHYVNRLQDWVILGDRASIRNLDPFDRFAVIKIRSQLVSLDESDWRFWLEKKRGEDEQQLDIMALNLFRDKFDDLNILKLDTIGKTTGAVLRYKSNPFPIRLRFQYQESWRIDLIGFLRDEFELNFSRYHSSRYENQDRVDAYLKDELGGAFSRDLYRSRISRPQ